MQIKDVKKKNLFYTLKSNFLRINLKLHPHHTTNSKTFVKRSPNTNKYLANVRRMFFERLFDVDAFPNQFFCQ
jgi:hypothetical protein